MASESIQKTGALVKLLEVVGIKEPAKLLENLFTIVKVRPGELNQGSLDIQAMYSEMEQALRDAGLDKISSNLKHVVKQVASKVKIDEVRATLDKLRVKDAVAGVDKLAEVTRLHAAYATVKDAMIKAGVPDSGRKIKQLLEESVLQERLEDFEASLGDVGIERPREAMKEIFEAAGLSDVFTELRSLLGWDRVDPV